MRWLWLSWASRHLTWFEVICCLCLQPPPTMSTWANLIFAQWRRHDAACWHLHSNMGSNTLMEQFWVGRTITRRGSNFGNKPSRAKGSHPHKKSASVWNFSKQPWPPPLYFIWTKVPQSVWIFVILPHFPWKMSKPNQKKYLIIFGIRQPPTIMWT